MRLNIGIQAPQPGVTYQLGKTSAPVPIRFSAFKRWQYKGGMLLYSGGGTALIPLIEGFRDISKYLAVGVIMFGGATWMLGHRPKAIEYIIGACGGFLIILYAWDLVEYLESLKK